MDFSLSDKNGKVWSLKSFKSKYVVIYFYPKDNTPGCTLEAIDFSKNLEGFRKLGAEVVGISGGDDKSKASFCKKHNLKILLLSDPDFKVCKEWGVYGEKSFMGRKFFGINRTTFILDKKRKVIKKFEKVNPLGHSKAVLEFLKSLT